MSSADVYPALAGIGVARIVLRRDACIDSVIASVCLYGAASDGEIHLTLDTLGIDCLDLDGAARDGEGARAEVGLAYVDALRIGVFVVGVTVEL